MAVWRQTTVVVTCIGCADLATISLVSFRATKEEEEKEERGRRRRRRRRPMIHEPWLDGRTVDAVEPISAGSHLEIDRRYITAAYFRPAAAAAAAAADDDDDDHRRFDFHRKRYRGRQVVPVSLSLSLSLSLRSSTRAGRVPKRRLFFSVFFCVASPTPTPPPPPPPSSSSCGKFSRERERHEGHRVRRKVTDRCQRTTIRRRTTL